MPRALFASCLLLLAVILFIGTGAARAHATSQVALTASYSIVGGGSNAQDLLTYVDQGSQQVVALTQSPTAYMVDSGSQWSVLSLLNGSTFSERWQTTNTTLSGTITTPYTVSFVYYHQYRVTFSYAVLRGGTGYSPPQVGITQFGAPASAPLGVTWVDASSSYSFPALLTGSSSDERWFAPSGTSGTVSQPGTFSATYYHQFLVSASYSLVGGGSPSTPQFSGYSLNSTTTVTLTQSTQSLWFDAQSEYSFTGSIVGAKPSEQWVGTTLVQTNAGEALSFVYNGTLDSPLALTPVYYHQFLVDVSFNYVGGNIKGLTAPVLSYQALGSNAKPTPGGSVWIDAGTQFSIPPNICCLPSSERWVLDNSTSGTISKATTIDPVYFYQYSLPVEYSIVGQPPTGPQSQPDFGYKFLGSTQTLALTQSPQSIWADADSTYTSPSTLSASSGSERWFSPISAGTISSASTLTLAYEQQYLLTFINGGSSSQWVGAGTNSSFATPGFFGRSQGTGSRIISYQIDGGAVVPVVQPNLTLSIPVSMDGPHTISFGSVTQFQVTLDAGAAGSLYSATPPTIPGDYYWYDSGSHVTFILSGAYGRGHGVGQRLTQISVTAQPPIQANSSGNIQAFATASLESPIAITTTSITQYEVVLNKAALSALVSVSPPSSFPNDQFWYNAGSPPVTVVLKGVYSRSSGSGVRTTSWQLGSGAITSVATTSDITIQTGAMTSPQYLNATDIAQFQITLDKAGQSALSSMTNPSISLDSGWYDASSSVGVIMNGAWGRSSGTGQRLAGYSLNGGPEVPVGSSGLVIVFDTASLSAPETISTNVTAQYQVTLDSGAVASLSSMTPPPIPKDNYWYDSGTPVDLVLNGEWGRTAAAGSRLVSYTVDKGAPVAVLSSGQLGALSIAAISSPHSITTKVSQQFHLSSTVPPASLTNSTLPGDSPGWFDAGTAVKAVFDLNWNQTNSQRQSAVSYSMDGGAKTTVHRSPGGNFTVSLTMNAPHALTVNYVTQYSVSLVGPQAATSDPPSPTGDSYYDAGSKVAFTVPTTWNSTSKGVRDAMTSYSVDGGTTVLVNSSTGPATFTTASLTFDRPHTLAFNGTSQYQVAIQFFDGRGATRIFPTMVQLGVGNTTVDVQGGAAWFQAGATFDVLNVIWEAANVAPVPPPSFHVAEAPLNLTLDTRVYPVTMKVVDLFGLPVSGAKVSLTLANGSTVAGTTKGDGSFGLAAIPLGSFTARVSSLASGAQLAATSDAGGSTIEAHVAFGLVSFFALIVVAAGGATGGVLAFKRLKRGRAGKPVSKPK